jgi:hypothetical protein
MSDDRFDDDLSSTPGSTLGILAHAALTCFSMLVTSPLWVPLLIIHKIRHRNDPKPKYRGTVVPRKRSPDDK